MFGEVDMVPKVKAVSAVQHDCTKVYECVQLFKDVVGKRSGDERTEDANDAFVFTNWCYKRSR
jgi:hypothetical protein